MVTVAWSQIDTFTLVSGDVFAAWVMAREQLDGATAYLKLKASGEWIPMAGLPKCGPDGLVGQTFPDERLLVADCPVGALVGRIGGSSASLKTQAPAADAGEGKPFAVGSHVVLKLPDKAIGPLYLGFNVLYRPTKLDSLSVEIWCSS